MHPTKTDFYKFSNINIARGSTYDSVASLPSLQDSLTIAPSSRSYETIPLMPSLALKTP